MTAILCSSMASFGMCADVYKLHTGHSSVQAFAVLSSSLCSCLVSHQLRGSELWVIRWQEVVDSTLHDALHVFKTPSSFRSAAQAPSEACNCVVSAREERKQRTTYYTGSTSSSLGKPSRLNPAIPKKVCQTSTMSPGLSDNPPNSESCEGVLSLRSGAQE
jgi:hypothetical protein